MFAKRFRLYEKHYHASNIEFYMKEIVDDMVVSNLVSGRYNVKYVFSWPPLNIE